MMRTISYIIYYDLVITATADTEVTINGKKEFDVILTPDPSEESRHHRWLVQ